MLIDILSRPFKLPFDLILSSYELVILIYLV